MADEYAEMAFSSDGAAPVQSVQIDDEVQPGEKPTTAYPAALIPISEDTRTNLQNWISEWLVTLKGVHAAKVVEWAIEERNYKADSLGPLSEPFIGACGDVVPVTAMAVDPIHARLDTGI